MTDLLIRFQHPYFCVWLVHRLKSCLQYFKKLQLFVFSWRADHIPAIIQSSVIGFVFCVFHNYKENQEEEELTVNYF